MARRLPHPGELRRRGVGGAGEARRGMPYVLALGAGLGWVMLGLAAVGAVLLARRRPSVFAVLLAFPVAYLLFMLRSELFFVRFALPAVPFLCLLAAVAVVDGGAGRRKSAEGSRRRGWRAVLTVGCARPPDARHGAPQRADRPRGYPRPGRPVGARERADQGAKMAVEEYTIRDRRRRAYGGAAWQPNTDLLDVNQLRRAESTASMRGSTRYFMVSSFPSRTASRAGQDSPQRQFYDALATQGRVVAGFHPASTIRRSRSTLKICTRSSGDWAGTCGPAQPSRSTSSPQAR